MDFNTDPYNDDFELNAKDLNYLKILFKPGYAVQARELTQIQSILQNQIKSLGDFVFKNGSPVIGGNITIDKSVRYIKLQNIYNNEDVDPNVFIGETIINPLDEKVSAKVMAAYNPSDGDPTLMIKYMGAKEFEAGDVIKIVGADTRAQLKLTAAKGRGSTISINDGIFYVNGHFVNIEPQSAVADAYSRKPSCKVGLEIGEDIVNYQLDSTLLDPAQESFNYQAPGADRYQITLTLATRKLTTQTDESKFIELMRIENGTVTKRVKYPVFSELEKTLARRTFDESGDYTVRPFIATPAPAANVQQYLLKIKPGKAYVKGFEFETIGTVRVKVPKPRRVPEDTSSITDEKISTNYGRYVVLNKAYGSNAGIANLTTGAVADLHIVNKQQILGQFPDRAANTIIGQAQIIGVERERVSQSDNDTVYDANARIRLYLNEFTIKPKVAKLDPTWGVATNNFSIKLASGIPLFANSYQYVQFTVLPIKLTGYTGTFGSSNIAKYSDIIYCYDASNVNVGDTIRVGDEVRVVRAKNTAPVSGNDWIQVWNHFTSNGNNLVIYKQTKAPNANVAGQTRKIAYSTGDRTQFTNKPFVDDDAEDAINTAFADQNTVVQLNYAIRDLKSIVVPKDGVYSTANMYNFTANIGAVSMKGYTTQGGTFISDRSNRELIWRLPRDYVVRGSLANVSYTHTKQVNISNSSPIFFLTSQLDATETVHWSATDENVWKNLIVWIKTSTTAGANGQIAKLTSSHVTNFGSGLKIDLTSIDPLATSVDVFCKVMVSTAETKKRTKTLRSNAAIRFTDTDGQFGDYVIDHNVCVTISGTQVPVAQINVKNGLIFLPNTEWNRVNPGSPSNLLNGTAHIPLYVPDMVKVRKIVAGNATMFPNSTIKTDVTKRFMIDMGHKDYLYDHARIIRKQGAKATPVMMVVHCDFFEHGGSGDTFFCADSYEQTLYDNGKIPWYKSNKTGGYALRDTLDFRPVRTIGRVDGHCTFPRLPEPQAETTVSLSYFLPRIDKLVLSKQKEFQVIMGVAADKPQPPDDDSDSMTLYNIYLPAWVGKVSKIRMKYINNKRYTMRDIGDMDKRIKRVEILTALNMVEIQALADPAQYEDGTNKEKYGIVGEDFKNSNIANYNHPDFTVSMKRGEMTPYQKTKVRRMYRVKRKQDPTYQANYYDTIKDNFNTISLDFTEEVAISQPYATKEQKVSEFNFSTYFSNVELNPDSDSWVAEDIVPEIVAEPNITDQPKEVTITETIIPRIVIRPVTAADLKPVSNAASQIIHVVGAEPPAVDPEDELPIEIDTDTQTISPDPVSGNPEEGSPKTDFDPVFNLPPFDDLGIIWGTIKTEESEEYTEPLPQIPKSGSGGGCVHLGSFVPLAPDYKLSPLNSNPNGTVQAYHLLPGDPLVTANPEDGISAIRADEGVVRAALTRIEKCYRIVTVGGTSLVCSESAPIPTLNNGDYSIVKAPFVLDKLVVVMNSNYEISWEKVESVTDIGDSFVRVIDAGDNCFWAGEKPGQYILHHNTKVDFSEGHINKN